MKVLFINSVCGIGSTGRICVDLAESYHLNGHEVVIAYGRNSIMPNGIQKCSKRIGTELNVRVHGLLTRLFDLHGLGSVVSTIQFLKWADSYNPDILWLHNIHGYYINYPLLFFWIKHRPYMQVKWTLHDCWSFTGHCSYFTMAHCDKWKFHCNNCPQKNAYPKSLFIDNSYLNFSLKKLCFTNVENLSIITPSKWLANLVKDSFLKEYSVDVVYNQIDKSVFKIKPNNYKMDHGLSNYKIVLGVANIWDERKGLKDLLTISQMLPDNYRLILVGLDETQLKALPTNVIGYQRTDSIDELVDIYNAADIFLNPTYEDNYPTVNLEAQACGTPVITYDTGGAKETLYLNNSVSCETGNIQRMFELLMLKTKDC